MINVLIDDNSNGKFNREYEKIILDVIKFALQIENINSNPQVSILIVGNNQMQLLNKKFRMIDSPTDVLSFPLIDFNLSDRNILHQENIFLGDIVISMDKVFSQANDFSHSTQREIAFLTAHGFLHLIGYDHINLDDEKIMLAKQNLILKKVGLER